MDKVVNLFTPIRSTITPNGGAVNPGAIVTIDTNVPATVLYSLDGSEPIRGALGTKSADTPVDIELRSTTRLRFKAFDNRVNNTTNQTKTQEATFTIARRNPLEPFRDTNQFFKKLVKSVVDENFYTIGNWVVPFASGRPYTYLFVNREGFPIRLRVLHNGIDVFSQFPIVGPGQSKEVPLRPTLADNTIEIQTERAGATALYDIGRYDIDTYD